MAKATLPKPGDEVFVIDDYTFEVSKRKVYDAPSEIIWVYIDRNKVAFGERRWAFTKAEATKKALVLATNRRQELTDRLGVVDAAIAKLGGK